MAEISIVVGLGNPGAQYRSTRHNLGFMVLDSLARRHALTWKRAAGPVRVALWRAGRHDITLIKPFLYMNESGTALGRWGTVDGGELFVVCDDLNLPLGQIRLRKRGGSGAHRGLDSIIGQLGTERFPRLRMGIGLPPPGVDWVEFVLSEFPPDERERVDRMVESAADAVELAARSGLDAAMNRFNRPQPPLDRENGM
jgi:PTH1 family peptidyl-tRNA hydrolase